MRKCLNILIMVLSALPFVAVADDVVSVAEADSVGYGIASEVAAPATDTIFDNSEVLLVVAPDSISSAVDEVRIKEKRDPQKAAWLSAICPGLGQIYNRQYWKVPIVYAGFAGIAYAITWNNNMYVDYRKAYFDMVDTQSDSQHYQKMAPTGVVINSSNWDYYKSVFKNNSDTYRRYRDISIAAAAIFYALTIVDAYVDAHLQDYDISPDLSMKVVPAVLPPSDHHETSTSLGVKCRMRF